MSRPSDDDDCGCGWAGFVCDRHAREAGDRAAKDAATHRVAELEAKLREAKTIISQSIAALGGDYAPKQVPEAIKQAFAVAEKAEYEVEVVRQEKAELLAAYDGLLVRAETDERELLRARDVLSKFARWWHEEMRDEMQPRHDMDGPHAGEWQTCAAEVCVEARAALGEKP